jgi:hypothetical protein
VVAWWCVRVREGGLHAPYFMPAGCNPTAAHLHAQQLADCVRVRCLLARQQVQGAGQHEAGHAAIK